MDQEFALKDSVPTSTTVPPPSTISTAPVMNDESLLARKRQTFAISSGVATHAREGPWLPR